MEGQDATIERRRYHCPTPGCPRRGVEMTPDEASDADGVCPECAAELRTQRGTGFFEEHGSLP